MEALTAVSVAALTVYDMLKGIDSRDGDRPDALGQEERRAHRGFRAMSLFEIRETALSLEEVIAAVARPEAGAIATFVGSVRSQNGGLPVTLLEYQAYASMAARKWRASALKLASTFPACAWPCCIESDRYRWATRPWCARPARRTALKPSEACRLLIDRIKARVPIWKREQAVRAGRTWVGWKTRAASPAPSTPVTGTASATISNQPRTSSGVSQSFKTWARAASSSSRSTCSPKICSMYKSACLPSARERFDGLQGGPRFVRRRQRLEKVSTNGTRAARVSGRTQRAQHGFIDEGQITGQRQRRGGCPRPRRATKGRAVRRAAPMPAGSSCNAGHPERAVGRRVTHEVERRVRRDPRDTAAASARSASRCRPARAASPLATPPMRLPAPPRNEEVQSLSSALLPHSSARAEISSTLSPACEPRAVRRQDQQSVGLRQG